MAMTFAATASANDLASGRTGVPVVETIVLGVLIVACVIAGIVYLILHDRGRR